MATVDQIIRYPTSQLSNLEHTISFTHVDQSLENTFSAFNKMASVYAREKGRALSKGDNERAEKFNKQINELDKQVKKYMNDYLEAKLLQASSSKLHTEIPPANHLEELRPDNYTQHMMPLPMEVLDNLYTTEKQVLKKPEIEKFVEGNQLGGKCYHLYKNFRRTIASASGENQPVNVEKYFTGYQGDDDIEIEEETVSYKCPISGGYFENPVRNPCGHIFSKNALLDYVKGKRRAGEELDCPVFGCKYLISDNRLEPQPYLAEEVKEYLKQQEAERTQANTALEQL